MATEKVESYGTEFGPWDVVVRDSGYGLDERPGCFVDSHVEGMVVVYGERGVSARRTLCEAGYRKLWESSYHFVGCTVDQAAAVLRLQGLTVFVEEATNRSA